MYRLLKTKITKSQYMFPFFFSLKEEVEEKKKKLNVCWVLLIYIVKSGISKIWGWCDFGCFNHLKTQE